MSHKNYEAVVGIDFGSSGCGFAYSFMNDKDINHGSIEGSNVDNKVPTEIILSDSYQILEFGARCIQYLKEKGVNAGNYFKGIKMHLYSKLETIKANNTGKSFSLSKVIQRVLEKIKELALEELQKIRININEANIKWVVTLPAIWEDFQKGVMMKACIGAGLIGQNEDKSLFFALEPEAASLYCSRNNDINQDYLKEGRYYIICDLGGGTGDIVTHEVGNNNHLKEIKASCGGNYGSNEIDKQIFEKIIYTIFGFKSFDQLLESYKMKDINEDQEVFFDLWCELERQIKDFKEGVNMEKVNKYEKFPINCQLFQDFFDDDINVEDLVNEYNKITYDNKCKITIKSKKKWIIEFPYQIAYNYIKAQADLINKEIRNILDSTYRNINTVIFVGGYCSNGIIISSIKEGLQGRINYFLQPSKPCLAIMEGAVLFGINPNIINTRIAKYTIGQSFRDTWNEAKHSKMGKKVYDEVDNCWRCEDCFSKFIEVKQKLDLNQEITKSYRTSNPRSCTLRFYQTLNPNPMFTFENGVDKIGYCELDAGRDYPVGQRDIKVTMKFGGTFIDVKAVHEKSGEEVKTTLNFY